MTGQIANSNSDDEILTPNYIRKGGVIETRGDGTHF